MFPRVPVSNFQFMHKVLCINYTTYDLHWAQDSLNPHVHADIMVLAYEESQPSKLAPHPYWYARIVGILHVYHIDFLWVCWFCQDSNHNSGWAVRRLHWIGFFDAHQVGAEAFGLVDPQQVIRAVHLIPAYNKHYTYSLLPPSIAQQPRDLDTDFNWYYVNQFVDRDMFMRFRGGGTTAEPASGAGEALGILNGEEDSDDEADEDAGSELEDECSEFGYGDLEECIIEDDMEDDNEDEGDGDLSEIDLGAEDGEGAADNEEDYDDYGEY
ncbi:hypothetical protein BDR05DRAFT_978682 [Suillus weaverae]|nr:hypothetical protein BDR05DRAFT_978682 [Suillus weaverae]